MNFLSVPGHLSDFVRSYILCGTVSVSVCPLRQTLNVVTESHHGSIVKSAACRQQRCRREVKDLVQHNFQTFYLFEELYGETGVIIFKTDPEWYGKRCAWARP